MTTTSGETIARLHKIADWLPLLALMTTSAPPLSILNADRTPPTEPPPPPNSGRYPTFTGPGSTPIRLGTIDLQNDVHAGLGTWVRLAIEECLTDDEWPHDSTLALCWWLIRNIDALAAHEAAEDFHAEVRSLWVRVRSAVGERPPRRPRCTRVVDGHHCGAKVIGMDIDGAATDVLEHWTWCACPACGSTYTFDAALRRLGQLQRQTIRGWADELGVLPDTLTKRIERAGVAPDGRDHRGRRLYDRATVEALVERAG